MTISHLVRRTPSTTARISRGKTFRPWRDQRPRCPLSTTTTSFANTSSPPSPQSSPSSSSSASSTTSSPPPNSQPSNPQSSSTETPQSKPSSSDKDPSLANTHGSSDAKPKQQAPTDDELRQRLEAMSGGGGEAGLQLEDGKPVAMGRGTKSNMFRVI
ncbi:MAG: hypothetical protein M1833_001915 [Piccolia ochrophora]|nr:MAG: hypothetical protein M1833_001915 [Piccolia ochrophora]